jgi:hypothetical protein
LIDGWLPIQRGHLVALFELQAHDLIKIDSEGFYILTLAGEKITSRPDFYAAFASPIELAVRHGSEEIGKLPTGVGLKQGLHYFGRS